MGFLDKLFGNNQAKAEAALARQQAEQYADMKRRVGKIKLDEAKMEEFYKKRAETLPELAGLYEALKEDPSLMEQLKSDPRFDEIARGNLEKIQEIAEKGGFTEEDMAKFREAERKSKAQAAANRKAIDRKMMEQGAAPGSGLAYAAQQQAAQGDAQAAASRMDQIAMQAAERERNALSQAANMAQGQQTQQFQMDSARAQAGDARGLRNLQRSQSALDRNLGLKQQLENLRAQGQAGYYDSMAALQQQQFNNELAKATMQANLQGQQSKYAMRGMNPGSNKWKAIGAIGGAVAGSFAGNPALGASLGSSIGALGDDAAYAADGGVRYNDGGVASKKKLLENMANKNTMNFGDMTPQKEEPSAADQIAAFNALQRQGRSSAAPAPKAPEASPKSNNDSQMLDIISTLINQKESAPKSRMAAADGGVRYRANSGLVASMTPGDVGGTGGYTGAASSPRVESSADMGDSSASPDFIDRSTSWVQSLFETEKPEFKESEMDYSAAYDKAKKEGRLKESPDKIKSELNADEEGDKKSQSLSALETIASALRPASTGSRGRAADIKPAVFDMPTSQNVLAKATPLRGIAAEDGAVKSLTADDMRDMLMQEVNAFACGGVKHGKKYEEGGLGAAISPADLRRMEDNLDTQALREDIGTDLGVPEMEAPEAEGDDFSYQSRRESEDALRMEEERDARAAERNEYAEGGITPELREATQMLRTNKPAPASPMPGGQPPMPAAPMDPNMMPPQAPQGAPMAPPMDPAMLPPQGAPMPPQGQMMADGGMAYEDGGEGTIIPGESFEGDQLPDRINSGEMVLNVEQQDRLNDQLQELKRLKSKERTDKMLADGTAEVNPEQQEAIMAFVRGEIDIDELPSERVVKEPSVGEPTGRMAELLGMLGKKKRG